MANTDPSAARPTIVDLDDVTKRYPRGTLAVSGLTLRVLEGEFVSLLGPSGCGKSTVLRLVAGLANATSGKLTTPTSEAAPTPAPAQPNLLSRPHAPTMPVSASEQSRGGATDRVGVVFQEPVLMPWETVADNVALPLKLHRRHDVETRQRVADVLDLVGLGAYSTTQANALSPSLRMRVSIGRALITQPRLLLLDDPFAMLEERVRNRLHDDLLTLWSAQKLTVLFVTRNVHEAAYLSTRVVVMSGRPGRVTHELPIDAVLPRGDEFRLSPQYSQWCRQIAGAMRGASAHSITKTTTPKGDPPTWPNT